MWVVAILVVFIMTFFFVFEQAGTTPQPVRRRSHALRGLRFRLPVLLAAVGELHLAAPSRTRHQRALGRAGQSRAVEPREVHPRPLLRGRRDARARAAEPRISGRPGARSGAVVADGTYLLHTIGELCLSPVGLSTVSKLAPKRFAGRLMGVFFFAIGAGNMLAGFAGSISDRLPPSTLFLGLFAITTVMAARARGAHAPDQTDDGRDELSSCLRERVRPRPGRARWKSSSIRILAGPAVRAYKTSVIAEPTGPLVPSEQSAVFFTVQTRGRDEAFFDRARSPGPPSRPVRRRRRFPRHRHQ